MKKSLAIASLFVLLVAAQECAAVDCWSLYASDSCEDTYGPRPNWNEPCHLCHAIGGLAPWECNTQIGYYAVDQNEWEEERFTAGPGFDTTTRVIDYAYCKGLHYCARECKWDDEDGWKCRTEDTQDYEVRDDQLGLDPCPPD